MVYYRLLCTFLVSQNFLDFASAGQRKTRIAGSGDTRTPRGYPFVVSFEVNGEHVCGGTILHEFLILTAAHCFDLSNMGSNPQYTIRAGSLDRENGGQVVKVKEYKVHEKFKYEEIPRFDVAILKLEQPLRFKKGIVGRVRMAKGNLPVGQQATVLGWGDIIERGNLSDWLRNGSVTILDQQTCSDSYYNINATEYAAFCAGNFENGGVDSCLGDSGGPLILESDGRQVGIVSAGEKCAHHYKPGIYTDTIQTRKWIDSTKSKFKFSLMDEFTPDKNHKKNKTLKRTKTRKIKKNNVKFVTVSLKPSYLVSIKLNGDHVCGGTILHEFLILTAAHCLYSPNRGSNPQYTIRAGSLDRENGGQVVKVKEYKVHEKFKYEEIPRFDVAILKLEQPLRFEEGVVGRAQMAKGNLPVGQKATVLGWGYTKERGNLSDLLRNVSVTILDQQTCSDSYYNINATEYAAFCAGNFENGGVDSCLGDSGGPLILESDGRQVGIVSAGEKCAHHYKPGIYTDTIQTRKWIDSTKSKFKSNLKIKKTNVKFVTVSLKPSYLVSIKLNGDHVCGGTILNEHIILTAAICLSAAKKNDVSPYTVQAGNLFGEKNSQITNIKDYEIHPKYKFGEINSYDAAILKLKEPLNFSTGNVRSVNLVDDGKFPFLKDAIAFEWHNVNKKIAAASELRNVTLNILNQEICSLVDNYANVTEYALFCADDFGKSAFDTCASGNGGPLILEPDEKQIGVVSLGQTCNDESLKPRLFTNIMEIRKWISDTITKFTYHVSDKPYFHSYLKRTEIKRIDGYRGTFLEDYNKNFRN